MSVAAATLAGQLTEALLGAAFLLSVVAGGLFLLWLAHRGPRRPHFR